MFKGPPHLSKYGIVYRFNQPNNPWTVVSRFSS